VSTALATPPASPVDEAHRYAELVDEGLTVEQIAAQAGRRPRAVRERLALLALTGDTLDRVRAGRLPVTAALAALRTAGGGQLPAYRPRCQPDRRPSTAAPEPVEPAELAAAPAPAGWFPPAHPLAEQARRLCQKARHKPGDAACEPCREAAARAAAAVCVPVAGSAARATISAALWLLRADRAEVTDEELEEARARIGRGRSWLEHTLRALLDDGELVAAAEPGRYRLPSQCDQAGVA
jgi:hypothetical protein